MSSDDVERFGDDEITVESFIELVMGKMPEHWSQWNLQRVLINGEAECPCCLVSVSTKDDLLLASCGHGVCKDCITTHIRTLLASHQDPTCPVCRAQITPKPSTSAAGSTAVSARDTNIQTAAPSTSARAAEPRQPGSDNAHSRAQRSFWSRLWSGNWRDRDESPVVGDAGRITLADARRIIASKPAPTSGFPVAPIDGPIMTDRHDRRINMPPCPHGCTTSLSHYYTRYDCYACGADSMPMP